MQGEGCASLGAIGCVDPAAMNLGDPFDDGEAQSCAVALGGEEWLERAAANLLRKTRTAVGHFNLQPAGPACDVTTTSPPSGMTSKAFKNRFKIARRIMSRSAETR